ncbi:MAG: hypothetical protein KKG00_09535 [Bacteroidetes bacterium]|nr:hypothetical protein [Bacteroidota bacterium]
MSNIQTGTIKINKLEAIEFNAQIQNGQIKIPPRFKNFVNKRVKVILLEDTEDPYKEAQIALKDAAELAKEAGLDQMSLDEINREIEAARRGE